MNNNLKRYLYSDNACDGWQPRALSVSNGWAYCCNWSWLDDNNESGPNCVNRLFQRDIYPVVSALHVSTAALSGVSKPAIKSDRTQSSLFQPPMSVCVCVCVGLGIWVCIGVGVRSCIHKNRSICEGFRVYI